MKNSPNIKPNLRNNLQSNDYNWRMYELLIAELKHQQNVWMDNFRVILNFQLNPFARIICDICADSTRQGRGYRFSIPVFTVVDCGFVCNRCSYHIGNDDNNFSHKSLDGSSTTGNKKSRNSND